MRRIHYSSKFKKDLKRAKRRGSDMTLLRTIIGQLANDQALDPKYRDHNLIGNYAGTRECHLSPDWLLIYRYESTDKLILIRTGTHSDLFK
jgi:mRNA interferase YafQ